LLSANRMRDESAAASGQSRSALEITASRLEQVAGTVHFRCLGVLRQVERGRPWSEWRQLLEPVINFMLSSTHPGEPAGVAPFSAVSDFGENHDARI
jgi:hypothetical protein